MNVIRNKFFSVWRNAYSSFWKKLKYIEYESKGRCFAGVGKVAVKASAFKEVNESIFKFFRHPAHHVRLPIVEIAVLPDQIHLNLEGVRILIVIMK